MGDLSPHFSRWEFAEHGSGRQTPIDSRLVEILECLRAIDGRPLRIVSGYRSPSYNRRVGGAKRSQHLYGRAADLEPGRFTVGQALRCGATGVGYDRDGWVVHVDTRRTAAVTFRDP